MFSGVASLMALEFDWFTSVEKSVLYINQCNNKFGLRNTWFLSVQIGNFISEIKRKKKKEIMSKHEWVKNPIFFCLMALANHGIFWPFNTSLFTSPWF